MKPLIGISTVLGFEMKRHFDKVCHYYAESVDRAGGLPFLLPLMDDASLAAEYVDRVDAIILSGGNEDVAPCSYGENPIRELTSIAPERDEWEFALYRAALEAGKPVLGVCRGCQVINVAEGGSLYQDIFVQRENILGHLPLGTEMHQLYHSVTLEPDSRLFSIFGKEHLRVNSYHHQAVKEPAPVFRVTARSEDGLIEAIEREGDLFVVGVQWHPEALTARHPHFVGLFRGLIEAVS